jgi:purine catabolism regulator
MPRRFPENRERGYGYFVEIDRVTLDNMSMLTVLELISDTELGLELVAGHAGAERQIEAAAVSELANPGPWLQGGELLLTIGLLLPKTVAGCRTYLAELDAAEVQAVGLGLGAELPHQRAPARLITAADEIGMPLLTVPDPVPFIAVTKAVFAYRARAERQELEWSLQTQRALTAAAVTPGGLLGILAAHRDATGRSGVVIDLLGRVLAESDPGGTRLVRRMSGVLESIREQGLTAAAVDISDGRRRELHALGAHRLRAWLLIDGPAELPAAHQISGDLVSLLSLELERRHGLNAAQRRGRAQVLDRLARATVDDVLAARWLTSAGLPDADLRAAAVAAPDDADDLAADLLITLPGALVRVVGEVVELACSAHLPAAGRRASASRCDPVRWWCRSVKPVRRCLPAGYKASTCTPRRSPAAGCCSTRLGRNPFRPTPTQSSARWTRRIDRVSCCADSPPSWNTTGIGDQPPPRCGSTGTPCATASKRSND